MTHKAVLAGWWRARILVCGAAAVVCIGAFAQPLPAAASPAAAELARLAAEVTAFSPAFTISPSGTWLTQQDPGGAVWLLTGRSGHKQLLQKESSAEATIVWSTDGRSLLIADADSAWIYRLPQGRLIAHLRGEGFNHFPAVAPDGRHFAFIRAHNVWLASMDGEVQAPLTHAGSADLLTGEADPLFAQEFGAGTHFWWSPDGHSIALIETQFRDAGHYPVAGANLPTLRLNVVNVETGSSRTLAESTADWPYLLRTVWHPDGQHLATYRMNRAQNMAELMLYNTGNGEARTLVTEKDGYWVNAPETPVFLAKGEQVVVSSERSGHRGMYLYSVDGSLTRQLTPADLEVNRLHDAVGRNQEIFVEGSTGNHQERHLYRVDTAENNCTQLTKRDGRHEVSLAGAGITYLDRYSSVTEASSVTWYGEHGDQRVLVKAATPRYEVTGEYLPIRMHDGTLLPARLFKPRDFSPQKQYPLIVYTYSGPHGRVVEDAWGGWQMAWNRSMVSKGFLVLAVDLRGSAGYGHLFEEYLHIRLGAQETADLHEVVDSLQTQPYVNRQRLGIWGSGYGGFIALHGMMEIPGGFRAGFADSPIVDWTTYNAYFVERYLGLPTQHAHEYDDSSPLDNVRRMTGTVLVACSPMNPIIRSDQFAALDKVLKRASSHAMSARVQRLSFAAPGYHADGVQLALLYRAMTDFFSHTL